MNNKLFTDIVICSFKRKCSFEKTGMPHNVEVYFGITQQIIPFFSQLSEYFDPDELLKSEKIKVKEDRDTYLISHTLLRIILANNLNIKPDQIKYVFSNYNKPEYKNHLIHFNLSHTRHSFMFAVSKDCSLGVDVENIDRDIDISNILNKYFSNEEIQFIEGEASFSEHRFMLLWTRKEALLKALGIGLINNLKDVKVLNKVNYLDSGSFLNTVKKELLCDHSIYSGEIYNYSFSIALPGRSKVEMHELDADLIDRILNEQSF